ncbi:hypothetical protein [Stenotrophomonas sp. GZD-301]|uniref:hypothetical protein n=1 Tax=Stenotrophomonas sp. GZD-301 TaxID=3404814 RepID=UPI003BB591CD
MNDLAQRRTYAVLALLLGLPTLAVGGTLSVLAVIVYFSRNSYMGTTESLTLLALGLSGILGLLGWLWLSGVYLRHGRAGLRRSSPLGWIGIACGVIGALIVLVLVMRLVLQDGWALLGYLIAGPPLLIPSAQLAWMRWSGAPRG